MIQPKISEKEPRIPSTLSQSLQVFESEKKNKSPALPRKTTTRSDSVFRYHGSLEQSEFICPLLGILCPKSMMACGHIFPHCKAEEVKV